MAMQFDAYKQQHPDRVYLDTPFKEKDAAKALGAQWDPSCPRDNTAGARRGKWYVPPHLTGDLAPFQKWLMVDHPQYQKPKPYINEWGYEPFESWKEDYVEEAKKRSALRGRGVGWCFAEEEYGTCPMLEAGFPCTYRHSHPVYP